MLRCVLLRVVFCQNAKAKCVACSGHIAFAGSGNTLAVTSLRRTRLTFRRYTTGIATPLAKHVAHLPLYFFSCQRSWMPVRISRQARPVPVASFFLTFALTKAGGSCKIKNKITSAWGPGFGNRTSAFFWNHAETRSWFVHELFAFCTDELRCSVPRRNALIPIEVFDHPAALAKTLKELLLAEM